MTVADNLATILTILTGVIACAAFFAATGPGAKVIIFSILFVARWRTVLVAAGHEFSGAPYNFAIEMEWLCTLYETSLPIAMTPEFNSPIDLQHLAIGYEQLAARCRVRLIFGTKATTLSRSRPASHSKRQRSCDETVLAGSLGDPPDDRVVQDDRLPQRGPGLDRDLMLGAFHVTQNQFLRSDDASLNPSDIAVNANRIGKVLVLSVCFDRNVKKNQPLGDPGSYSGSVTIDDSRLSGPATVPLTVTMQYSNWAFLLWLYFAAAIPGIWCVWVLKSARNGTDSAFSLEFFKWAKNVSGLVRQSPIAS